MSVIRLIHIKVAPAEIERAKEVWRTECSPLMIRQKGCNSEMLLHCRNEPSEFISYSEWNSEADIEEYRTSDAHKKIVAHSRGLEGASAAVKIYDAV